LIAVPSNDAYQLPPRFAGVRVVGDVHGDANAFFQAVEGAGQRGLFVAQLGDLVDYGPDSAGCLRLAIELVTSGNGMFLLGNHDEKLSRILAPDNEVRMTQDLAETLASIDALPNASQFRNEVRAALSAAPLWLKLGRYFLVHGGFDTAMLEFSSPDAMPTRRMAKRVRNRALLGQTLDQEKGQPAKTDEHGYPIRLYDWVNDIPNDLTVLIGHDPRSTEEIVEMRGIQGGRVLFCDTGCSKGGKLSWLDLMRADFESAEAFC
jgi:hypothetical protein